MNLEFASAEFRFNAFGAIIASAICLLKPTTSLSFTILVRSPQNIRAEKAELYED